MYKFVLRFTALSQGFTFRDFTSCSRVKKHFVKSIDLYLDLDLQICVKNNYRNELFTLTLSDVKSSSRVRNYFAKSIDLYLDLDLQICVKVDYRKELFPQIFRDVTSGSGVRKYFAKSRYP